MPLHSQAQKILTMVTARSLYTPMRVPQGVFNATNYFPGTIGDVLEGLRGKCCKVWVHDIGIWGRDWLELMQRLRIVLN